MSAPVPALLLEPPRRPKGPYTYASAPRALYNNAKRRNEPSCGSLAPPHYANVMHDKRVVRGSTFASHPLAAGDGAESGAARAARSRRRALARRAAAARLRPGTPPPAPGRDHHPVQTEHYLEELFDKGVEFEVGVQTDLFADRPATPVYVPARTGADAATQILPGELFDFDAEVRPILEVLVGKTSEQALAEVAQEEELATLRERQRRYRELRDAERAERRRLAEAHERLRAEKERRVAEARGAREAALGARERAAAAALVHGYVGSLLPGALAGLRDRGYLVERVRRGADDEFVPWLVERVSAELAAVLAARDLLEELVREAVVARAALHRAGAERAGAPLSPPDSLTPPSEPDAEADEPDMTECSGVVCAQALEVGARSRPFSARALAAAAAEGGPATTLARLDAGGLLADGARLTVRARLAPHVCAARALLAAAPDGSLRVRVVRAAAPGDELLLWFADCVRAAVHLPFLAPHHIRGEARYECEACGARFDQPNPLKMHLLMRCEAVAPARVWRLLAARLEAAAPPAPAPTAGHVCVFCGKLCSRKYGLKIHIRTHTGARPLRCAHCARAFGDPSNLNKHVRLHARRAGPLAAT